MGRKELCEITGCSNKVYNKSKRLCHKHYSQVLLYGKVYRTRFDPNRYKECKNIVKILLENKDGNVIDETIVDKEEFFNWIKNYKWHLDKDGYAVTATTTNKNVRTVFLHKMLMPNAVEVDHKNRKKLDNRKSNLRACSKSQNQQNRKVQKNNTSKVPGVWFHKQTNKWVAEIKINNKKRHLGIFSNFHDAVEARKKGENRYFDSVAQIPNRKINRRTKRHVN